MKFNQRVGRAFGVAVAAIAAQQAADQGCFAGAQIAFKVDDGRRRQIFRKQAGGANGGPQRLRRRRVGQVRVAAVIIAGMHDWRQVKEKIRERGAALGFAAVGFAAVAEDAAVAAGLSQWLAAGYSGDMDYMARHAELRSRPQALLPQARAVIVCRMDYRPAGVAAQAPEFADISCYARGRDYHKVLRRRLKQLAAAIAELCGPFASRACVDSAPLAEVALAAHAGLGWRGKNTLLLSRSGSWFFLGELLVSLPLPPDTPTTTHCGACVACLEACPTDAFSAPHQLDARRCISYLTIEHRGAIPPALRPLLGNRVYGCDVCQSSCPWNRFSAPTREAAFAARDGLDAVALIDLFGDDEAQFLQRFTGSPIRRIGHERWLRNLAVALGNAPTSPSVLAALAARRQHPSALVREHVAWALTQHQPG